MSYHPKTLPTNVEDAVYYILTQLDDENRAMLKAIPHQALTSLHHDYGPSIRNGLGLWGQNRALMNDPALKGMAPDSMSMILVEKVWDFLQAQDGDTNE